MIGNSFLGTDFGFGGRSDVGDITVGVRHDNGAQMTSPRAHRPMNARNDFDQLILTPLCAATLKNYALIALCLPIFNLSTTRTFDLALFIERPTYHFLFLLRNVNT